ncbi:MAG: major capsid protein, partial [Saprospiraceae bacterium]|nr:major capsid protein [Saprospiraceae bacterium]
MGAKYLPSVALPVNRIRTEVIEATGGLTNEHMPGTDPQFIQRFGTRVQEYTPPKYKEKIHFNEEDILYLRELGNNGRNVRGIRQYIDKSVDQLNRRLEARIEKLRWDTIFDGGFSYFSKVVSFGIPSANRVVPLGAVWSSDGISANDSAEPLEDIRNWTMGGTAAFRKYKIRKMVMNPNTARWILDNANVQSLVSRYFSNDVFGPYELNKTIQLLIPGAPEVVIYDGWYQEQSVDGSGKITVGDATYFIADGLIYFEVSNLPGGDQIGEFVQSVHLAEGSVDTPGFGKFLIIEDNTQPGTKGGPSNPFIDIIAGVYGGPKLDRPFDVLTANVL